MPARQLVWEDWYARRYGVAVEQAADHYLTEGWRCGFDPNPLFSTTWYQQRSSRRSPRVSSPLVDYVEQGWWEGRDPGPRVVTRDVQHRLDARCEPIDAVQRLLLRGAGDPRVQAAVAEETHSEPPFTDEERRWRDLVERRFLRRDSFVVYRILGNDLPPRQEVGRTLENLRFILEHEEVFPDVEKRFIVNRIVDAGMEDSIIETLEAFGAPYLHLPFDPDDYRTILERGSGDPPPGLRSRLRSSRLPAELRERWQEHGLHQRYLYVFNNNGARNLALEDGRKQAAWILPLDGSCFLPEAGWEAFRQAIDERPYLPYVLVPMVRLERNEQALAPVGRLAPTQEPQLAFRHDARERFDERLRYGRRPKVELLWRLGVPGPWDHWPDDPWDPPRVFSPDAGAFHVGGWLLRLSAGSPELDLTDQRRWVERGTAARTFILDLDARIREDHG